MCCSVSTSTEREHHECVFKCKLLNMIYLQFLATLASNRSKTVSPQIQVRSYQFHLYCPHVNPNSFIIRVKLTNSGNDLSWYSGSWTSRKKLIRRHHQNQHPNCRLILSNQSAMNTKWANATWTGVFYFLYGYLDTHRVRSLPSLVISGSATSAENAIDSTGINNKELPWWLYKGPRCGK